MQGDPDHFREIGTDIPPVDATLGRLPMCERDPHVGAYGVGSGGRGINPPGPRGDAPDRHRRQPLDPSQDRANRLSALLAAGLGAAGGALGMQFGTDCARIPVNQFSPSVVLGGLGAAAEVKRVVSEPDAVANGLSGRAISYAP